MSLPRFGNAIFALPKGAKFAFSAVYGHIIWGNNDVHMFFEHGHGDNDHGEDDDHGKQSILKWFIHFVIRGEGFNHIALGRAQRRIR